MQKKCAVMLKIAVFREFNQKDFGLKLGKIGELV